MVAPRRRLDAELVRRGLVESRQGARRRIEAGDVLVNGSLATKAARMVSPSEPIEFQGPPPQFVGRGAMKLEAAFDAFGLDPQGQPAIDVGASTGGFTDSLLQRGAARVVALDVGHGQMHERLRADERVVVIERCNVRDLDPARCDDTERRERVGPAAPIVVVDLSFISLRTVASALAALTAPGGDVIALVKPQFEAGRQEVSRGGGVVDDAAIWERVVREVVEALGGVGLRFVAVIASPLRGASGNVEFLVHFRKSAVAEPAPAELDHEIRWAMGRVPPWP